MNNVKVDEPMEEGSSNRQCAYIHPSNLIKFNASTHLVTFFDSKMARMHVCTLLTNLATTGN